MKKVFNILTYSLLLLFSLELFYLYAIGVRTYPLEFIANVEGVWLPATIVYALWGLFKSINKAP